LLKASLKAAISDSEPLEYNEPSLSSLESVASIPLVKPSISKPLPEKKVVASPRIVSAYSWGLLIFDLKLSTVSKAALKRGLLSKIAYSSSSVT
jgi:hypothetical protein